jgi:ferredoxin
MTKYRIVIRREDCIGDKQCTDEAPDTFELDEERKSFVVDLEGDPPESILAAARGCPMEAIELWDLDSGRKIWPRD